MDGLQVGCWKLEWGTHALGAGADELLTCSLGGDKLDSYLSSSSDAGHLKFGFLNLPLVHLDKGPL